MLLLLPFLLCRVSIIVFFLLFFFFLFFSFVSFLLLLPFPENLVSYSLDFIFDILGDWIDSALDIQFVLLFRCTVEGKHFQLIRCVCQRINSAVNPPRFSNCLADLDLLPIMATARRRRAVLVLSARSSLDSINEYFCNLVNIRSSPVFSAASGIARVLCRLRVYPSPYLPVLPC